MRKEELSRYLAVALSLAIVIAFLNIWVQSY